MTLRFTAGGPEARRALTAWRFLAPPAPLVFLNRATLHDAQRGRCYLCLDFFGHDAPGRRKMSRDHVFPKISGGGSWANILLAHRDCNERKSGRWPTPCEVLYLAALYTPRRRR